MYQIAVVEDSKQDTDLLIGFLKQYQQEHSLSFSVTWYQSAETFLEDFQGQYDILFMDIRMGGMDGMEAAHRLREKDESVVLVFLTSLAQYAVQGYEVDATDYILKPINYPALQLKMRRILRHCKKPAAQIFLKDGAQTIRLDADDLLYVEIYDHHLHYRTKGGLIKGYGTLKDVMKILPETGFFRINNQTIVNLRHVRSISGNTALVDERAFDISRSRKKDFLSELHQYGIQS